MAQDGDTITYTFSDGTSVSEDVSEVDEMTVDYLDGAGGADSAEAGGIGGRVENTVVDIGNYDTIYLWVGGETDGRYNGGGFAGGSTEVAFVNTDSTDSDDEPFIVGAGGGGSGSGTFDDDAAGGARGGDGSGTGEDGEGVAPPQGGDGDTNKDGDGAVASISEIKSSGTTTEGGGSEVDGEIQISYASKLFPPEPPENLTAELL